MWLEPWFCVFIGCTVSVEGSSVMTEVGERKILGSPPTSSILNSTRHPRGPHEGASTCEVVCDDISGLQLFVLSHTLEWKHQRACRHFQRKGPQGSFCLGKSFLFCFVFLSWDVRHSVVSLCDSWTGDRWTHTGQHQGAVFCWDGADEAAMQGPSGSLSSFAFLTLKGQLPKVPRAFCLAFQGQRQTSGFFINDRVALLSGYAFSFQKSTHRSQSHLWPWEFLFRRWSGLNVIPWLFLTSLDPT